MYVMSRIERGTYAVQYWTGHTWTKRKANAKQYKTQQAAFDAKDKAGLNMPVNVNKA